MHNTEIVKLSLASRKHRELCVACHRGRMLPSKYFPLIFGVRSDDNYHQNKGHYACKYHTRFVKRAKRWFGEPFVPKDNYRPDWLM